MTDKFSFISVVKMKSQQKDKTGRFVIHTVQLKPRLACKSLETQRTINVTSQAESAVGFNVQVNKFFI